MALNEKLKKFRQNLKWLDPFTYVDLWVMPKLNPHNNKLIEWVVYIVFAFLFALSIYLIAGLILGTGSPMVIVVSGSMQPEMYRGDVVFLQGVSPENLKGPQVELDFDVSEKTLDEFAEIDYENQSLTFSNGQTITWDKEGDVPVYFSNLGGIQIIHRIIAKIKTPQGIYLLTKGDNALTNTSIDQDCGQVIELYANNELLQNKPKAWFIVRDGYCYCAAQPVTPQIRHNGCLVCSKNPCNALYPIKAEEIEGIAVFRIPWLGYVKLLLFDDLPALLRGSSLN